jgi:HSP20 family protein
MAVFRWGQQWTAFHDLEREVDRLLQGMNLTVQGLRFSRQYPPINLYELENEFLLTAELPGTLTEDLELTVESGVLTLSGKRSDGEVVSEERFRRQERPRGSWQRSLKIPDRVQDENMSAEFTNGVLKIHLPKATGTMPPRQIPVVEGNNDE